MREVRKVGWQHASPKAPLSIIEAGGSPAAELDRSVRVGDYGLSWLGSREPCRVLQERVACPVVAVTRGSPGPVCGRAHVHTHRPLHAADLQGEN